MTKSILFFLLVTTAFGTALLSGCPPSTQTVVVPSVVGMDEDIATSMIVNAGLQVGTITRQFSTVVPEGRVMGQNPLGGERINLGTTVRLTISRGPQTLVVPNVVGMVREAAEAAVYDAGLTVGPVTEQYSDLVNQGNVISQNPAGGTSVNPGSAVGLVVSKGPEPIEINTLEQLQSIGSDIAYPITANYVLTQNINASATAAWNGGKGFDPIGNQNNRFSGRFDGNNRTVTGLVINRPEENYVALFAYASAGSVVENLRLSSTNVVGQNYVGGLVGKNEGGEVRNCSATLSVAGEDYVGGIMGWSNGSARDCTTSGSVGSTSRSEFIGGLLGANEGGTITSCQSNASVTGFARLGGLVGYNSGTVEESTASGDVLQDSLALFGSPCAGGLIGHNDNGTILLCGATGDVLSEWTNVGGLVGFATGTVSQSWSSGNVTNVSNHRSTGGLIGSAEDSVIIQCFAEGVIAGDQSVGGLIGDCEDCIIGQSYATAAVTADSVAGGLVGFATGGSIFDCYAAGSVTGDGSGGLLADSSDSRPTSVSFSFWDIQATGITQSAGGEGRTSAQMRTMATFVVVGWDFDTIWGIEEGASYPYLLWTL